MTHSRKAYFAQFYWLCMTDIPYSLGFIRAMTVFFISIRLFTVNLVFAKDDLAINLDLLESDLSRKLSPIYGSQSHANINNAVIAITQDGIENLALINQSSSHSQAAIFQQGMLNNAEIKQFGSNNQASITQYGNENNASILQDGIDNTANITQHGKQEFRVEQLGDNQNININQH